MRGLYGIIAILLIGICAASTYTACDTEIRAQRWERRVASATWAQGIIEDVQSSQKYSGRLLDALSVMASENGILCERDAASMKVIAEFEDENRRLKTALAESIDRLQSQETQINDLIDGNGTLRYKIQALEQTIESLEGTVETLEEAIETLQGLLETRTPPPFDLSPRDEAQWPRDEANINVPAAINAAAVASRILTIILL